MKFLQHPRRRSRKGFTLVEVAMAMAIAGLVLGGIILGYVQILQRAKWSAYSLAAHSLAQ